VRVKPWDESRWLWPGEERHRVAVTAARGARFDPDDRDD
jgi:hypothetical protein